MIKITLRSLAEKWPSDIVARTEIKALPGESITRSIWLTWTARGLGLMADSRSGGRWPILSMSLSNGLNAGPSSLDE